MGFIVYLARDLGGITNLVGKGNCVDIVYLDLHKDIWLCTSEHFDSETKNNTKVWWHTLFALKTG